MINDSYTKNIDRYYKKLDEFQLNYYHSIFDKSVVCVNAPAGTGKTTIAVMAALQLLHQGEINHIYYVRFPDDRSLRVGFLPGDTTDKESIYFYPLYDALTEFGYDPQEIDKLKLQEDIITRTDIAMRGINISKSMMIIDEAQNGRLSDLKLVLTRIHDDCKCILLGHSGQYDNFKGNNEHAFEGYIDHLCKKPWSIKCELPINHRGKISSWADQFVV